MDQDTELTSAAISGQHLYITSTEITDGKLVLHATNINDLLELSNDGCPQWEKHVLSLSYPAMSHIDATKASVSLFPTKLKNPRFTET